jgi:hypothetical protein
MTQNDLNREVAQATGETISTIKHLGFLLDDPSSHPPNTDSADLGTQTIDWDDLDVQRSQSSSGREHREPVFA